MTIFDNKISSDRENFRASYQSKKPFKYLIIDNALKDSIAQEIHDAYPNITDGEWDGTTYLDQKNKFQKTIFEKNSLIQNVFDELNSESFLEWLNFITEIEEPLEADPTLSGGGLHQSLNGAFLNVHVDFNIHPKTKLHRRLNVLIYMNKDWKDEYEGHLELWEIDDEHKNLLEKISPKFNRLVLFETNEISFLAIVENTDSLNIQAQLDIDRTKWGITYGSGSFIEDLGDKAIKDEISYDLNLVFEKVE